MGRVIWACVAVILLGDLVISKESETSLLSLSLIYLGHRHTSDTVESKGNNVSIQIINFNFERTYIKWNVSEFLGKKNLTFLYGLNKTLSLQQCPHYIFDQGYTAGCLFKAGDNKLTFLLKSEDSILARRNERLYHYLKPNSPTNVRFTWREDSVTIKCSNLNISGLIYEIQYKSILDQEWQTNTNKICNVTIGNLDSEKCYFFRARVTTKMAVYGSKTYPSDWSPVTHWKGSKLEDSCTERVKIPSPKYIYLITSLTILLMVFLLLLFLRKTARIKTLLMPVIPDPKYFFPGLFDFHRGNFQEWIQDTENLTSSTKEEHLEQECIVEEGLKEELAKKEAKGKDFQEYPQLNEDKMSSNQLSCEPLQGSDTICLGDLKFVMNDNTYIIL